MSHSFIKKLEKTPPHNIVILLTGISAIATVIIYILMRPIETSSYGILDLEFAWTIDRINTIFDAWGSKLINQELKNTLVDYGFLATYSTFFAGVTLLLTRKLLSGQIQLIGFYMTLTSFVAAIFDAIENLNLILMLTSPNNFPSFAPPLASICATVKFGLLILLILFWIISILWVLYHRFSGN
jgi:hypothetical protein